MKSTIAFTHTDEWDSQQPYHEWKFDVDFDIQAERPRDGQLAVYIEAVRLTSAVSYCEKHGVEIAYDGRYQERIERWFLGLCRGGDKGLAVSVDAKCVRKYDMETCDQIAREAWA